MLCFHPRLREKTDPMDGATSVPLDPGVPASIATQRTPWGNRLLDMPKGAGGPAKSYH